MSVIIESLTATPKHIDEVATISPQDFGARYFRPKKPVLITNMLNQWPAMKKWSFEFFRQLNADQTVYLEDGNVLQGETAFQRQQLNDYLQQLIDAGRTAAQNKSATPQQKVSYLSVFNIFTVFPQLQADVDFSLIRTYTYKNFVFAWLGPAGTLTGYHIDWIDNTLAQLHGRKRVQLVAPADSRMLYPSTKYDYRSTLSSLDPRTYDPQRYPRFADVQPLEVILEPGQLLYIPRGWWHRVESLDPSISVNNFGHDWLGMLFYQPRASLQDWLHHQGLYGRECTCHMVVDGKRVAK